MSGEADLQILRLHGDAVEPHLDALADLRIRVFRDWPYLYDGDPAYERRYLRTYAASPGSVVVLVRHGGRAVGASTGLPLEDETDDVVRPFRDAGLDPRSFFYCGESVLEPEFRGRGLGVRFFEEREAHARDLGRTHAVFAAVQRPDDHPLRPHDTTPLDGFWRNRGYERHPDLVTTFSWRDVGNDHETRKPMAFWTKRLEPDANA